MPFTESNLENAIIELFRNQLDYDYVYGPNVDRDYSNPLFMQLLFPSLRQINPDLGEDVIEEVANKIQNIDGGSLVQKNEIFTDYLQNGVEVKHLENGEEKTDLVKLIDYDHVDKNNFTVVNQWTVVENAEKRPDIVVFINGLPLVVVELKSPSREEVDASAGYRQLKNYQHDIPQLFIYNAFCVMSDQATSKAGTITSDEDRFMEWKTIDGNYENTQFAAFDVLFAGMFDKKRILDILQNFICFAHEEKSAWKILAAYHQYFAVRKAVESIKQATFTDGKGGVFWHTQGSGKSLSMVFLSKILQTTLDQPTIVVITDRNDLDGQLYSQFSKCAKFLRQQPLQATSRNNLKELLQDRAANGIFFTTMQKFTETDAALSERKNIVVMSDEAHRSQYGLAERVDAETGKVIIGAARIIRDNLPNATYIGFTGTPIATKDRNTREVFGDYIDVYDMTQAIIDKATVPVYYESRVMKLQLNQDVLNLIDQEYDLMSLNADNYSIEKSKKTLAKMDSILGAPETITALCTDVIDHYENNREHLLTGKAMIVAYSRPIAMMIYREILCMRPEWQDKIAVVMTGTNDDPESWREVIGNKEHKKELAAKFKDDDSELKIVIVVDMWLTGFDVPSLATMYVYKPMIEHNLMQAIARVNRVFSDKEGGLVVDYVGIASALKKAMNDYTRRDQKNFGDPDISKAALPKFNEKLEICRDLFHGFDYKDFFAENNDLTRARAISSGVNFLLQIDDGEHKKSNFIKEALALHQTLSLCQSLVSEALRLEAAYFEAVRTLLTRINSSDKISFTEINQRINELLKQSIKSEGVINLFSDVKSQFNLFDSNFLNEIAQMQEKNLALEMLKKLISEQIKVFKKTNLVKSEKFSEILSRLMNNYLRGMLTNEQVIEELLKIAQEMQQAQSAGQALGLDTDELAFYDALTKPQAIKDFYTNDKLIAITKELTISLKKNRTIDWQKKETARAGMRKLVKHLLKKYDYPPEGMEDAVQTVISQCEMWSENE